MHDLDAIAAFLDESHHALAADVAAFARADIAVLPEPPDDDAGRAQARDILQRLGDAGWCRHAVPPASDANGEPTLDLRAGCLIREALAWASPLADDIFAIQCLASLPLSLAGTDAQKARHLPGVARGETMMAFAMTEPEAGSDVAAIQTRAERHDDGWTLNGTKTLISNAGLADLYVVFASTNPAAGHRGLSCFVVPADTPGCRFAGPQILAAAHPLGTMVFDDCRLPDEALLGTLGGGFRLGMQTLDRLRATVAAAACGMAARALDEGMDHARNRRQFGAPLADLQMTQQKLARMATDLTASRLLTYRAAAQADAGGASVTLASAMAKSYATEAAQRIVDDAVQIVGGRGVLADHPVDRLYRSVRALRIYEGATEVQHIVIARRLLKAAAARDAS